MLSRLVMIARSQLTGSKVALSALTKPNIRDRAIIRQICNIKTEDVATARPRELLVKLELKDLDLTLRERASFAGLDMLSVLEVQSDQHVIYRLMEDGGQGGPR